MFILLLSHALVELPKRLYHLSAIGVRSKLYCHELGAAAAELELEEPQWASWSSLPSTRPEDSAPSACLAGRSDTRGSAARAAWRLVAASQARLGPRRR